MLPIVFYRPELYLSGQSPSFPTGPMDDSPFNIQVQVLTDYIDSQSDPSSNRYVFSYTITISNDGREPAQLLNRHWVITDANGKVEEVKGRGVVGEQPHIKPGQNYVYTSGAVITTPVGSMQGSYEMVGDDGTVFQAEIPPFSLAMPNQLH